MDRMKGSVRLSVSALLAGTLLLIPSVSAHGERHNGFLPAARAVSGIAWDHGPAQRASRPDIDAAQLIRDVEVLAADEMEGRMAGTPGGAKARAYLLQRLKQTGLKPLAASFEQPFEFTARRNGAPRQGVNLLGLIRGTARPNRYIVVTAHYDHVGIRNGQIYNGADDNATGAAALLAMAAHFVKNPPETSLVIAALDAEESGLRGARAFLASDVVATDAIVMNVNLDMIGRDGKNILYAAGTHHYPALKPLLENVAQPPVELRFGHDVRGGEMEDWTNSSDHAVFHQAGIPFIYFGVEDFENHHKPSDDAATIQQEFFAGAVRTIIVALERLAGA